MKNLSFYLLAALFVPALAMATEKSPFEKLVELYENSEAQPLKAGLEENKKIRLQGKCFYYDEPSKPVDFSLTIEYETLGKKCTGYGSLFGDDKKPYCEELGTRITINRDSATTAGNEIIDSSGQQTYKYINYNGDKFLLKKDYLSSSREMVLKLCYYN